jgi:DNA-directed RNA polymerase specialized sigma24 family protein
MKPYASPSDGFATARAVVRDSAVAEEVTQEVFLKLYRHSISAGF